MFKISDLLNHNNIIIQCHDIPDADTIASAFAIFTYLKQNGKNTEIIYSGREKITKSNLTEMISRLSIPLKHVQEMPKINTLVLVDCQYGERNVSQLEAENIFVIDHHIEKITNAKNGIINSHLGSCSTLVWSLLIAENFDFAKNSNVATALYYGLYTDTSDFEEIAHPLDKDMRDSLKFNKEIIKDLQNNTTSLDEFEIVEKAQRNIFIDKDLSVAILKSEHCDSNILSIIADRALDVKNIKISVVYCYDENRQEYKLSVRSCTREIMANDLVELLTKNNGRGNGNASKASGIITDITPNFGDVTAYIASQIKQYSNSYDIINSKNHNLDFTKMKLYKKKNLPIYYVKTLDIFPEKTPITIRTLEGETDIEVSNEMYIMIGSFDEIYPISAYKLAKSYTACDTPLLASKIDFEYAPSVINKNTFESVKIMDYAKCCIPTGESQIYAMPLTRKTKVFTDWKQDGYFSGNLGDYIAVRTDDMNDVYIIRRMIFDYTYVEI